MPGASAVTFKVMEHDAPEGIVPPLKLTVVLPAAAANAPPQLSMALGVAATCKLDGKLSVTATPVNAAAEFGLVIVRVRLVVPFTETVVAPNAFLMEGGATTVTLAEAMPPVPPSFEVTVEVMLFFGPKVAPVTFTEKAHEPAAGRLPPDILITPLPGVAVIVLALQLTDRPLGVEITRPGGKVSLNPTPVSPTVGLVF